ncbi:AIR synthase-related protein, partial [Methylobacterium hispanicum]
EMAMAGDIGAALPEVAVEGLPAHAYLFGEDQGRYLIAVEADAASDILYSASSQGIDAAVVGVTGSDRLTLPGGETISVADLRQANENWLPAYMASQPAAVAS